MELADTLAVMDAGCISQLASSRDVYERPKSLYVAGFVGELNQWPAEVVEIGPDRASVRTAFGTFNLSGSIASRMPGARGHLIIRPERVRIEPAGAPGSDGDPRVRGTVREVVFLGARCEVRVTIPGAEVLIWLFEAVSHRSPPTTGQEVEVVFDPGSLQWLDA